MRRRLLSLAAVAAACSVLGACGGESAGGGTEASGTAVAELRRIDPDASRLLGGGIETFRERIAAAKGRPVVVNQWASWCGPCRFEFPFLESQARKRRGTVAFLGVNSRDSSAEAAAFLRRQPTSFPHVEDPDAKVAREFRGGRSWPTTAFYDADGKLNYTRQGSYRDEAALARDIERYAGR